MIKECEIINPSDEVYITGEEEPLCAAVMFLGEGHYALKEKKTGDEVMPLFLFGMGFDKFWPNKFGRTFEEFMESSGSKERVIECLKTVKYARERSSLNDIGGYAEQLIKNFQKSMKEPQEIKS